MLAIRSIVGATLTLTVMALAQAPSAEFHGVVTNDLGEPVADATVRAARATSSESLNSLTDDDGHFVIANAPPGSYTLSVSKATYPTRIYGAMRNGPTSIQLDVAGGQVVDGLTIALPRGSVITGNARLADGESAADIEVSAVPVADPDATPVVSATTDNTGVYRLFGLPAGKYLVAARMSENNAPAVPTLFGGTTNWESAAIVELAVGETRERTDIQLIARQVARVRGSLRGLSLPMLPKSYRIDSRPATSSNTWYAELLKTTALNNEQGGFEISDAFAGQQILVARPLGRPELTASAPVWGATFLVAEPGAETTADIDLRPALSVDGHVRCADDAKTPDARRMRELTFSGAAGATTSIQTRTAVGADGSFHASGFLPGAYTVSVLSGVTASAVLGFSLGGLEHETSRIEIADTNVSDLTIHCADSPSLLRGMVQKIDGTPSTGTLLIVMPSERDLLVRGSRRMRAVRLDSTGRYAISGLPPGDYIVGLVVAAEYLRWQAGELHDLLTPAAVKVQLAPGASKTLDLRGG